MKKASVFLVAALSLNVVSAQNYFGLEAGSGTPTLDSYIGDAGQYYADRTQQTVSYTWNKSAGVARVFGGTKFSPELGFELGYFLADDITVEYLGLTTGGRATHKYSMSGLDAVAVFRPYSGGFFVKGGLHMSEGSLSVQDGGALQSVSESGTGLLYGLGYEILLWDDMNLRTSFVRYSSVGGVSEVDLDFISVGINKDF
jgi:hypothetical protein